MHSLYENYTISDIHFLSSNISGLSSLNLSKDNKQITILILPMKNITVKQTNLKFIRKNTPIVVLLKYHEVINLLQTH